jgi:sugar-specific transcriptional regulator TrmB
MADERILVVTTVSADQERLRERLEREIPEGAEVRIVAPATKVSALDWLTNAEDDARAGAEEAAERTAEALDDTVSVAVDRTSHNTDAAQDIQDALRQFRAEEIVVVTSPDDDRTWLEDEAVREALAAPGIPVRRIEL